MHERFQQALEVYQELSKRKSELSESSSKKGFAEDQELRDLESAVRVHERMVAERRGQETKIQRRIFALQGEKALIMKRLREDLAELDNPNALIERDSDARLVSKDRDGHYVTNGKKVTAGMLLTDGEWGLRYQLDASVPRVLRKKFLIETAKRTLRTFLDQQIIEDSLGSERTHEDKKKAYSAFKELKGREDEVGGWVAERLIKTFFKRIAIDYDLDIDLIETDVYEDVEHKIDFVIRRKSRARGVEVEAREEHQDLGIQFTMRNDSRMLEHKRKQIERVKERKETEGIRVDDVLLVSMPLEDVRGLYKKWKKTNATGGPGELWSMQEKQEIFKRVLAGVVPDAEIEAQWRIVSGG